MIKLNKKYNLEQLKELVKNGKIELKRDYSLDTKGLNSSGLLVRFGIKINNISYQVLYNSKEYAKTITSDITFYNERIREKHFTYLEQAQKHFYKNVLELIEF